MYLQKFIVLLITLYSNCYQVLSSDTYNYSLVLTQMTTAFLDSSDLSSPCYKTYFDSVDTITNQLEKSRGTCMDVAKSAYAEADKKYLQQQKDFQNTAQNSCNTLIDCSIKDRGAKVFECFASEGAASAQVFFKISSDANIHLTKLQKEYRDIDDEQEACNAKAQSVFDDDVAEAGIILKKCLNNS